MAYKDKNGRIVIPGCYHYPINHEETDSEQGGDWIDISDISDAFMQIRDKEPDKKTKKIIERIYDDFMSRIITDNTWKQLGCKSYKICPRCNKELPSSEGRFTAILEIDTKSWNWLCYMCINDIENGTRNISSRMDNRDSNNGVSNSPTICCGESNKGTQEVKMGETK